MPFRRRKSSPLTGLIHYSRRVITILNRGGSPPAVKPAAWTVPVIKGALQGVARASVVFWRS